MGVFSGILPGVEEEKQSSRGNRRKRGEMGRYIVKLQGYYFEWSTIVDAPVTFGMTLGEFEEYYQDTYGIEGIRDLPYRLERVEMFETSSVSPTSAKEMLAGNRAGPDEETLTVDEIYKAYCLQEPIRDGWKVPTIESEGR